MVKYCRKVVVIIAIVSLILSFPLFVQADANMEIQTDVPATHTLRVVGQPDMFFTVDGAPYQGTLDIPIQRLEDHTIVFAIKDGMMIDELTVDPMKNAVIDGATVELSGIYQEYTINVSFKEDPDYKPEVSEVSQPEESETSETQVDEDYEDDHNNDPWWKQLIDAIFGKGKKEGNNSKKNNSSTTSQPTTSTTESKPAVSTTKITSSYAYGKGKIMLSVDGTAAKYVSRFSSLYNSVAACMTDLELAKIAQGSSQEILLVVNEVTDTNGSDWDKINNDLNGDKPFYLDLKLYLVAPDGEKTQLSETYAPIQVEMTIPGTMKGNEEYYILRCHNGEVSRLTDIDDSDETITFETQYFSAYALAGHRILNGQRVDRETTSGNNYWILIVAIVLAVLVYVSIIVVLQMKEKKQKSEQS